MGEGFGGWLGRMMRATAGHLLTPSHDERRRRLVEPLLLPEGPLAACHFVVFDLETTGLAPSRGDRIVAIGAVRLRGGVVDAADSYATFCHPGRPIPAASTAIHGITDAMVRDAVGWPEAVAAFHAYAKGAVLVAHNAAFDLTCLHLAEPRAGVSFAMPALCSMRLSLWLDPTQTDHSLDALAARHGVVVAGRHDALGDAVATAHLFADMLRRAELAGVRDLDDLMRRTRMRESIAAGAVQF
ncbi:3'-5' exonuclease [Elioraea sp.]|uniref:3'-5' exonuclease n=1 Tax=Elioraea sp. TaxID=2185103 RepID=UPI003F6EF2FF